MKHLLLNELVTVLESGSRPKGGVRAGTGEVLSLGAEHLSEHGDLDLSKAKRIPQSFFEVMGSGRVEVDDILIVKDGATTGRTALIRPDPVVVKAAINEHVFRLRINFQLALPSYVFHFLRSATGQSQVLSDFRGATVGGISRGFVDRVKLPVPSLKEQGRIVAILDTADAIRRKRRESLLLFEQFSKAAFAQLVGSQNRNYSKWPEYRLVELAESTPDAIRTGPFGSALRHSEFVDSGVAVLGIDNAVQNRFAWAERRFIPTEKYSAFRRYTVKPGDVIVTIMGTTGRSAVVPDSVPLAISTKHLAVITVDRRRVIPQFLSFAFHSDQSVLMQIAASNRGAIMAGLNLGLIKRLRVRVPPLEEQERFANIVSSVGLAVERVHQACIEADRLFTSLNQWMFNGPFQVVNGNVI